ncbi:MAG: CoA transferase [Alphaproteobacteria bacterium HGW-Alphaproteobacteria-13]|nr:MAG: CoA transferase [Alphaproteobacteria bacterium HGW-Alphaproteobacteria-13]
MTALLNAVSAAGARLGKASHGRIAFDARQALSRHDDLALGAPGLWSPNRHCRLIPCRDAWIAVSLARAEDRDMVPAWTGAGFDADIWQAVMESAAGREAAEMTASGVALHLPVARVGEARPPKPEPLRAGDGDGGGVVDLSALWAGPYCGGLLAEAGFDVVKIESPARPDPTPLHTPRLDARLNGRKRRLTMALASPDLIERIAGARILITAARAHALARLGLSEERLFAVNPGLLWIAVTAHGWRKEAAMRVGFGDDCAAAGGLLRREEGAPRFMGDALADPLTGLTAATLALEAVEAGQCGLLDISLARTAAAFAEALR